MSTSDAVEAITRLRRLREVRRRLSDEDRAENDLCWAMGNCDFDVILRLLIEKAEYREDGELVPAWREQLVGNLKRTLRDYEARYAKEQA